MKIDVVSISKYVILSFLIIFFFINLLINIFKIFVNKNLLYNIPFSFRQLRGQASEEWL